MPNDHPSHLCHSFKNPLLMRYNKAYNFQKVIVKNQSKW